jgi:hypothetical protein
MARRTGKDGNVLLGAGPTIVPALREWTYREGTRSVDATAAGDDWDDTEALRGNFEVTFRSLLEIAGTYVIPAQGIRGTKAAFVLEVLDTDANGLISGTGLVEEIQVTTPHDGMVEITGRIVTGGTAPTWDLSPLA